MNAATTRCRALVGGFGRPGMRDLDIGRPLVRYLESLTWGAGVVVEDLCYAAPLVLHRLQELEPAKVVLVGAALRGGAPGALRRYPLRGGPPRAEQVQRSLEESVQGVVDIDHTLAIARHYGALPPETVIIEVEPADCSFGPGFSETLAASFDAIVALVREELGRPGENAGGLDIPGERSVVVHPAREPSSEVGPSPGLTTLIRYAREHEESRTPGFQRERPIDRSRAARAGLALAGRRRPWGVNLTTGGSDWFDAVPLENGWWGCLVGDVAGRGAEATASMVDLRAAARAYAILDGRRPARVLEQLDRLARATGLGAHATLVYVALHPASGELRLSNAASCPPLIVTQQSDARFVAGAMGHALGAKTERPEERIMLDRATTVLLFTDGLVGTGPEPVAGALERLRHAVVDAPRGVDELCDHVLQVCLGQRRRDDDVCLLALRSSHAARGRAAPAARS